jgi:hypothetical protein
MSDESTSETGFQSEISVYISFSSSCRTKAKAIWIGIQIFKMDRFMIAEAFDLTHVNHPLVDAFLEVTVSRLNRSSYRFIGTPA